jgi:dTMP kinase
MITPLLIVFEGIDGSGKTTQARWLAEHLESLGISTWLTREPSDGPIGQKIRSMTTRPNIVEEILLFTEDRRDHVRRVILPALARGQTVICDRYVYSSVAYQGARGADMGTILAENREFARHADVTFLLEIPVDLALERIQSGRSFPLSPFESREQLLRVAAIYQALDDPSLHRVDATVAPTDVAACLRSILRKVTGCVRL